MTVPEITCFHIAVVVADVDKAIANYKRFLGEGPWRVREGAFGRLAYGSAAGQTWELIQPSDQGGSQFHRFREQHGEGIQHIGFWTPDIRASVEQSLAAGAQLVWASTDAEGNAAVQLLPAAKVTPEHLSGLGVVGSGRLGAFMDLGFGGWRLEYIGKAAGEKWLADWLAEDYDQIILTPAP